MPKNGRPDAGARERRDRDLFNRIAVGYARKDTVKSSSLARRYLLEEALAPLLTDAQDLGTVLDVGCGVGAPALHLRGRYRRYIGVDQSAELIAAARRFNAGNADATFIVGNAKEVDLVGRRVDLVLVLGALHHMTEPDRVIDRLVALAAPGARLVMVEPSSANPAVQALRLIRGLLDPAYSREQHFFARRELQHLVAHHGLAEVEVAYLGYLTPPFAQVVVPFDRLATRLSRLAVRLDATLHRRLPGPLRFLAWDLVVRARFPRK